MVKFINYVNKNYGTPCKNYNQLYAWSVDNSEQFWEALWNFSNIKYSSQYNIIVDDIKKMPGAKWFQGSLLNFAENLLKYKDDKIAIWFYREDGEKKSLTYNKLYKKEI